MYVVRVFILFATQYRSYFSAAGIRRSRCGSVRGNPVLSSHFSPGFAPQVGQRTATFSRLGFMATPCTITGQQDGQL
jgi:hypothetical protein